MKVGSLVGCTNPQAYINENMIVPDDKAIYTVREIIPKGTVVTETSAGKVTASENIIYLEELVNTKSKIALWMVEPPYLMKDFSELMPPMENVMEDINENVIEYQPV